MVSIEKLVAGEVYMGLNKLVTVDKRDLHGIAADYLEEHGFPEVAETLRELYASGLEGVFNYRMGWTKYRFSTRYGSAYLSTGTNGQWHFYNLDKKQSFCKRLRISKEVQLYEKPFYDINNICKKCGALLMW